MSWVMYLLRLAINESTIGTWVTAHPSRLSRQNQWIPAPVTCFRGRKLHEGGRFAEITVLECLASFPRSLWPPRRRGSVPDPIGERKSTRTLEVPNVQRRDRMTVALGNSGNLCIREADGQSASSSPRADLCAGPGRFRIPWKQPPNKCITRCRMWPAGLEHNITSTAHR